MAGIDPGIVRAHFTEIPTDSEFDHLPIIPHEHVAKVECCGCLMVRLRDGKADILCNECGDVIRTVPVGEVESTMLDLSTTDVICSAHCTHCGTLNTFPHSSSIEAFICFSALSSPSGLTNQSFPLQSTMQKFDNHGLYDR